MKEFLSYPFQLAKKYCHKLKISKTMLFGEKNSIEYIDGQIGFSLVLKVMEGLQGSAVSLINNKIEFNDILSIITVNKFKIEFIAQESIMSSKGKDIRVVFGGNYAEIF